AGDRFRYEMVGGVACPEAAVAAVPPAVGGTGGGEPAGVIRPGGYGRESEAAGYRCRDKTDVDVASVSELAVPAIPPAVGGAVGGEPAGVGVSGGDGREGEVTCDWGGYEPGVGVTVSELAGAAVSPAVGGSCGGEPAGVVPASGDGREGEVPRDWGGHVLGAGVIVSELTPVVAPPAVSGSCGGQPAGGALAG